MSDTPRTDAEIDAAMKVRDLERELAEQKEQFRCVRWQLLLCRQMGIPYLTSCFVCAGERQILLKECGK
jgi:hypothetical protein